MRRSPERGSFYGSTSHDLILTRTLTLFCVLRDDIVVLPLPVCWAVVMTCLDTIPALCVGDHKSCWINNIRFKKVPNFENTKPNILYIPLCFYNIVDILLLLFWRKSIRVLLPFWKWERYKAQAVYVFCPLRKESHPPTLARLGKPHERTTTHCPPCASPTSHNTAMKMPGRRGKDQLPACLWYWTIPILETFPRPASLSRLPLGGPEPHTHTQTYSFESPKE